MPSPSPMWKQVFDAIDKRVSPTMNQLAASEDVANLAALGSRGRSEVQRRLEQASRRTLHLLNIPAGSDVNRLLTHIAALEREVRELRNELSDRENAQYLTELASRRTPAQPAAAAKRSAAAPAKRAPAPVKRAATAKGGARGKSSHSGDAARTRSA